MKQAGDYVKNNYSDSELCVRGHFHHTQTPTYLHRMIKARNINQIQAYLALSLNYLNVYLTSIMCQSIMKVQILAILEPDAVARISTLLTQPTEEFTKEYQ